MHQGVNKLRSVSVVVGSDRFRIGGTLVAENSLDERVVEVGVTGWAGSSTSERSTDPVVVHGLGCIDDNRKALGCVNGHRVKSTGWTKRLQCR